MRLSRRFAPLKTLSAFLYVAGKVNGRPARIREHLMGLHQFRHGAVQLINLKVRSLAVGVKVSGLLHRVPASHLPGRSQSFTLRLGGKAHFSSFRQALVAAHYGNVSIESSN